MNREVLNPAGLGAHEISRGSVEASGPGEVLVRTDEGAAAVPCDVLEGPGGPLRLLEGDRVLVWRARPDEAGVVLGRIGPRRAPEAPDELVIEARKNLTIKCGEGSITFREDGKILIKGRDLVSRAQRNIRLKGGSVALN